MLDNLQPFVYAPVMNVQMILMNFIGAVFALGIMG